MKLDVKLGLQIGRDFGKTWGFGDLDVARSLWPEK